MSEGGRGKGEGGRGQNSPSTLTDVTSKPGSLASTLF